MSSHRDIMLSVIDDLNALMDRETNHLVLTGAPTDGGTIETQRGIVLGIRAAMDAVHSTFKEIDGNG